MSSIQSDRREAGAVLARRKLYHAGLARNDSEILAAQRLSHRVLAEEMGAPPPTAMFGIDRDLYDAYCEHLVVRDEAKGRIVGTCRILSPDNARRVGNYSSDNAFDLNRLKHLRGRLVEAGRACIDAEYRSGAVLGLLWTRLAEYMSGNGHEYLIGSVSIGMGDGGHNAANLFVQLVDDHLAPIEYRVFPRCALPFERLLTGRKAETPPLLKACLRAGAWVCGEPAWNPDFNSADLFLLLPMSRVSASYRERLVKCLEEGVAGRSVLTALA